MSGRWIYSFPNRARRPTCCSQIQPRTPLFPLFAAIECSGVAASSSRRWYRWDLWTLSSIFLATRFGFFTRFVENSPLWSSSLVWETEGLADWEKGLFSEQEIWYDYYPFSFRFFLCMYAVRCYVCWFIFLGMKSFSLEYLSDFYVGLWWVSKRVSSKVTVRWTIRFKVKTQWDFHVWHVHSLIQGRAALFITVSNCRWYSSILSFGELLPPGSFLPLLFQVWSITVVRFIKKCSSLLFGQFYEFRFFENVHHSHLCFS